MSTREIRSRQGSGAGEEDRESPPFQSEAQLGHGGDEMISNLDIAGIPRLGREL